MAGFCREFGVVARKHGILLLSVPSSGVKVVHASTFAFVCAWIGRRHDELHCAMVFKKPGFGGRHKLVRPRIIHAVDDKRRRRPMRKIGPGCQNNTTLSVGYSREGSKADGVNPSEAVREHQASAARVCNVPFREHQASAVLSCNVPVREHQPSAVRACNVSVRNTRPRPFCPVMSPSGTTRLRPFGPVMSPFGTPGLGRSGL